MSDSTPQSSALKVCTKCGEAKPLTDFYKVHTGLRAGKYQARCKSCHNAQQAQLRANNPEKFKMKDRLYHESHREEARERTREWVSRNRDKRRQFSKRYTDIHAERRIAHGAVNDAVRRGKFPPAWAMVCEHCQEAQAAHWHHHKGYSKEFALDVVAVCVECHVSAHKKEIATPDAGFRNLQARLTKEQVIQIRWRATQGETLVDIARSYGVARTTINSIVHNRTWRNI